MDIHKPKAAHNWREFLTEIGTIICGILIALGLEQVVEAVHRHNEVREAREALQEEIRTNLGIVTLGMTEDRCLLEQLPAFIAWARGGPKAPHYRSLLREYNTSTFETVKTTAVPHMPLAERLAIAGFYDQLEAARKVVEVQRERGQVLFGVEEYDRLTEADAHRLLDSIAVDRRLTRIHLLISGNILDRAERMGLKPPKETAEERETGRFLCTGANQDPTGIN